MDYLKQINRFNRYTEHSQTVSTGAQLLYYKLLDKANSSRWADWIQVGTGTLMELISVESENTFYNLRDELIELGLIEVQKGKRGKLPRYYIYELSENNTPIITSNFKGSSGDSNRDSTGDSSRGNPVGNCMDNNIPNSSKINNPSLDTNNTSINKNKLNKTKLNKTKLNNNSSNEELTSVSNETAEKLDIDELLKFWNEHRGNMPEVRFIRGKRLNSVKARCREYSKQDIKTAILNAERSDFLNGKNNNAWIASFDWIMKPNNFIKVLEDNYKNQPQNGFNKTQKKSNYKEMPVSEDTLKAAQNIEYKVFEKIRNKANYNKEEN